MARVTNELLANRVTALNRTFHRPETPYTLNAEGTHYIANADNFHLSEASGGVALVEMCEGSGTRLIFPRCSKAELFDLIGAMMRGAELARKL